MTRTKIRAILALFIWSLVMIGLCVEFFFKGGSATFLEGEHRVALTRAFFTVGCIFHFIMLFFTRRRPGRPEVLKDERDEQIEKRSLVITFYVILLYIFLLCMFLYWYYKIHQMIILIPLGWIWFLGISSIFVGNISLAGATLILEKRMSGYGQS